MSNGAICSPGHDSIKDSFPASRADALWDKRALRMRIVMNKTGVNRGRHDFCGLQE